MKKLAIFFTLLFLTPHISMAQNQDWHERTPKRDLDKAFKAYNNGLYRDAYFLLDGIKNEKVYENSPAAKLMMGVLNDYAYPTLANPAWAAACYKDAAAAGMAEAQNNLGMLYYSGRGVAQSYTEAARLFQQAADQKYAKAQSNLADIYFTGRGVDKSEATAFKYYKLAADNGIAAALYSQAYMLENGLGGADKDMEKAAKLYAKAADKDDLDAQNKMGEMYETGIGEKTDINRAVTWYQKAAAHSNAKAQYNLGRLYRDGTGVVQNDFTASDWFKKAATNGNLDAMLIYAKNWETGKGTWEPGKGSVINPAVAVTWYLKAATSNKSEEAIASLKRLGYSSAGESLLKRNAADEIAQGLAAYTQGQESTCFRVLYNYRTAPEFNLIAVMSLAGMYEYGFACPKNDIEAKNWYIKAANLGSDVAIYRVARMHEEGTNGFAVDMAEAKRLYTLASGHGFTAATEKLNNLANGNQGYTSNSQQTSTSKYTPTICSCCHGSGTETVWQTSLYQQKDQYGREMGTPSHYVQQTCSCCHGARVR
ncbi:MAG: tetratricopeptide repeat protein [Chitinophagaceae bacterium]